MERNYYYLKEILLGLRQAYMASQMRLELLKDYISYSRFKYKNVYFSVNTDDGIRNTVNCNLTKKNTPLMINDTNICVKTVNENGLYKFDGLLKELHITDDEKFSKIIATILNDEFISSTRYTSYLEKDADGNKLFSNIMFDPKGIYISSYLIPEITYTPKDDIIKINMMDDENPIITLDTKVLKDNIPNIYIDIIRETGIEEKQIEMFGVPKSNKGLEYDIEESDSKVLLIRRY